MFMDATQKPRLYGEIITELLEIPATTRDMTEIQRRRRLRAEAGAAARAGYFKPEDLLPKVSEPCQTSAQASATIYLATIDRALADNDAFMASCVSVEHSTERQVVPTNNAVVDSVFPLYQDELISGLTAEQTIDQRFEKYGGAIEGGTLVAAPMED